MKAAQRVSLFESFLISSRFVLELVTFSLTLTIATETEILPPPTISSTNLLESLEPADTSRRFEEVDPAQSLTFEWLFTKFELGFESWLRSGRGLYWVRGHPGSGKSTLMKWALNDSRTTWRLQDSNVHAKAKFFFHNRGSEIQKSFKGLLQSLVHQILKNTPELVPKIIPIYQDIKQRRLKDWTQGDVEQAFNILLEQKSVRLDLAVFLDALDEYDGDSGDIVRFLKTIMNLADDALTKIMVSFSSRPLQIYLDEFHDVPGFSIHEQTRQDIALLIGSRLSENARMYRIMQDGKPRDKQLVDKFAEEATSKAEGIFLWVKLALDELLEDFTAGETLQNLLKRLMSLPTKLGEFYQHTMGRVPSKYLDDAAIIFEVLRCALGAVFIHDLFKICQCATAGSFQDYPSAVTEAQASDYDGLDRWLRTRTGGLVQLTASPLDRNSFSQLDDDCHFCPLPFKFQHPIFTVQFIHQTVKTFSESGLAFLAPTGHLFPFHNGHAYITRYILALAFHHPQRDSEVGRRSALNRLEETEEAMQFFWGSYGALHQSCKLLLHIQASERHRPCGLYPTLIEFGDKRLEDLFSIPMWTQEMKQPQLTSVSELATFNGNYDLLDRCLEESKKQSSISAFPLVKILLFASNRLSANQDSQQRLKIFHRLLTHDGGSMSGDGLSSVYQQYCRDLSVNYYIPVLRRPSEKLAIVRAFLQNGQDPNVWVDVYVRVRKRQYRNTRQTLLHHAAQVANCDLIHLLLGHGAAINPTDEANCTPLDCACDGKREDVGH